MAVMYDAILDALRQQDFVWSPVPASPTASGVAGNVAYDSSYFYVAVAANTWVRTALTTWTPPVGDTGQAIGIFPLTLTYA